MLLGVSVVVAVLCVAASFRRLRIAIQPTAVDAKTLVEVLRGDAGRARFGEVCRALGGAGQWERELVEALTKEGLDGDARAALVNEQLADLDWRLSQWARVPRVCASVASSAGLLLGALALRAGLTDLDVATPDTFHAALDGAAARALGVVAVGVCGTVWCIALNLHAQRAAKARLAATDQLVERLENLAGASPSGHRP